MRPRLAGPALCPQPAAVVPPDPRSSNRSAREAAVGGAQGPDTARPLPLGEAASGPPAPQPHGPLLAGAPHREAEALCAPALSPCPSQPGSQPRGSPGAARAASARAFPPAVPAHTGCPPRLPRRVTPGLPRLWGRTHTFSRIWNNGLGVWSGCSADPEVVLGGASLGLPFPAWASGLLKLVSLPTRRAPAAPLTTYCCFCSRDSCLFLSLEIQRHTFPTLGRLLELVAVPIASPCG